MELVFFPLQNKTRPRDSLFHFLYLFRFQVQLFSFCSKNIQERIGVINSLVFIFYCQGAQRKTYNYQLINLGLRCFNEFLIEWLNPVQLNFEKNKSSLSCFIQLSHLIVTTRQNRYCLHFIDKETKAQRLLTHQKFREASILASKIVPSLPYQPGSFGYSRRCKQLVFEKHSGKSVSPFSISLTLSLTDHMDGGSSRKSREAEEGPSFPVSCLPSLDLTVS